MPPPDRLSCAHWRSPPRSCWSAAISPGQKRARKSPRRSIEASRQKQQFREARSEILTGDYDDAAETLRALDENGKAPPQIRNWITMYAGLAELLAGHEEESRPIFARLDERVKARPARSGEFLGDLGLRLSGADPMPSSLASRYDRPDLRSDRALSLRVEGRKTRRFRRCADVLPAVHD